jgi:hypothetical protein
MGSSSRFPHKVIQNGFYFRFLHSQASPVATQLLLFDFSGVT